MRAVGITEFGGPDALQIVEVPEPEAGSGQVRIRVRAAAVNPTDTLLRDGSRAEMLKNVPPPHVPGMDAAGVLDQIGPGVQTELQVGDAVMAVVLPHGTRGSYAEKVVVPAESVVRAPAGASHAEAASLLMNALTVRAALDALDLQPGQLLAVTGAAGAVWRLRRRARQGRRPAGRSRRRPPGREAGHRARRRRGGAARR